MKAKLFFTSILAAFIGFCLLIVGVCTVSTVKTQSAFAATTGEGTEENPYVVTSLTELNEAMDSTTNEINYIRLDGNISSSGTTVTLDATDKEMVLDLNGKKMNIRQFTVKRNASIHNGSIEGVTCLKVSDGAVLVVKDINLVASSQYYNVSSGSYLLLDGAWREGTSPTSVKTYHTEKDRDGDCICEFCTNVCHTYENTCDATCDNCGATREASHTDSNYDYICEVCNEYTFDGAGTATDPYLVRNDSELKVAFTSTANEVNYIKLTKDITTTGFTFYSDAKPMVLDLDGFAFNGQDCTVGLCNGGTIKNGTINGNMMIEVADYSGVEKTATLEGLTFTNSFNKAVRVLCGTLNINNCNIDAERNYAIWVQGSAAKCTATNVQLSSRDGICLIEDNGTFILDGVTKSTDATKTYHTHKDEDNNGLCDICDETFTPATDDVNDKANDKGGDGEGCGSSLGFGLAGLALAVLLVAVTKKKEA